MSRFSCWSVLVVGAVLAACTRTPEVFFTDETNAMGLNPDGGPVCWLDVDGDGWVDLIYAGTCWRNDHGHGFIKMQEGLGAAVAADYDNDGYPDLFDYRDMKLFHNEHGQKFVEVPLPVLPTTSSRAACWGDFNNDGFVDLYIGGFEDWDKNITYPSMILMNQGGKGFRLTWSEAVHRTRGVTACNFDRGKGIDVYASNYRLQPNQLWINDGKGNFKDEAAKYNVAGASPGFEGGHSIGAAWGDFDNDGNIDLFSGQFAHVDERGDQPKSRFLRNTGVAGAPFKDLGPCGIFYQESYATPTVGDYDNDGHLDLFFTTDYPIASFNRPNYPVLFRQTGNFQFTNVSAAAHLDKLPPTYQAAWADFNHDGYLDLFTATRLFVNHGKGNHWLEVRLSGDGRQINRSAIGAQVRIRLGGEILTRQVEAGTGEGNQNDLVLHFGLGAHHGPVDLEIFWPNDITQTMRNVAIDQIQNIDFHP